ncbi:hypothetical protein LINPERHAP2_LOCUS5655, partial [Linum perenne]
IVEPKVSKSKAANVISAMGFDSKFWLDASGFKVNSQGLTRFPEAVTLHLHKLKSDHRPIILRSQNQ